MNPLVLLFTLLLSLPAWAGKQPEPATFNIEQTVVKVPVAEDLSVEDIRDSMQSKASELNMKFVAHQPVWQELKARGVESGVLEIFQFCNPGDAKEMVDYNPIFAAYMPCRIALVEDREGQLWLMMINLDMLINTTPLPPKQKAIAERINRTLNTILKAAAEGDF